MLNSDLIMSKARCSGMRIGIGGGKERRKVEKSVDEANAHDYGIVTLYDDPLLLAMDLLHGRIDAAVRGDLDANPAMRAVREVFGVRKVLRIALLQPQEGGMFFFAPVGIDEGWTVDEKLEFIRRSSQLMRKMGVEPKVGVLSGGRSSDKGRMERVDRTIDDAEEVVVIARSEGYDARYFEILIEDAAAECNLILAPDGISGNLVFRTLHFLGNGKALGAPILNIDRTYIDTSRAKADYLDSIALAATIAGSQKL